MDLETDNLEYELAEHWKTAFDLYKALGLKKEGKINGDRVRSAYSKLSYRFYPQNDGDCEKKFYQATLAFMVLRDEELRRIYDTVGYMGLQKCEEYSEYSLFSMCPYEVHDDFYNGKDPEDKEWLLLNGPHAISDDEGSDDTDMEDAEEEEADNLLDRKPVLTKMNDRKAIEAIINKPPPVPTGAAAKYCHLLSAPSTNSAADPWTKISEMFANADSDNKTSS
mmetsp:Transcript_1755/g.2029  ORF Transcript_1755/g.2029 Transcript_1755/m.2029 type:complete len:223 (-) Transcript_1755:411-1079(-)